MRPSFERLKETWLELGRHDPLWAVVTRDDARGGRWDLPEFFQTGEQEVARYHHLLGQHAGGPRQFDHVLDFGCGVGRLSRAWSTRAKAVTGVDLSPSMIERGRLYLRDRNSVDLRVNEHPDLRSFPDETFDLVFSHICLQHMAWPIAAGYVREFARVCRPGGWVVFQLPSRRLNPISLDLIRKNIVDHLPFGLDRVYRRWRRGCAVIFEMHLTPPGQVTQTAQAAGLAQLHREPDPSAGETIEGFIYIFQKRGKDFGDGIERTESQRGRQPGP